MPPRRGGARWQSAAAPPDKPVGFSAAATRPVTPAPLRTAPPCPPGLPPDCPRAENVVVVVSRWFGGILLGPSRFGLINNCARELLVQTGFITGGGSGGESKGGGGSKKKKGGR
jgi:hypothetical protein